MSKMKKDILLIGLVIVISVSGIYSLMAHPYKIKQQKISLSVSVAETEVILKALGKLPLEESGDLFFNIQRQAQAQLTPKPKTDSTAAKPKKQ